MPGHRSARHLGRHRLPDSELTDNFCGFVNADGKPERQICPASTTTAIRRPPIRRPRRARTLPVTPEWKANATARYEFTWRLRQLRAGLRDLLSDVKRPAHDRTSDRLRRYRSDHSEVSDMPSYTVADFAAGFGKDGWRLELFVRTCSTSSRRSGDLRSALETVCGERDLRRAAASAHDRPEVLAGVLVG